jgi:hypothetical protein
MMASLLITVWRRTASASLRFSRGDAEAALFLVNGVEALISYLSPLSVMPLPITVGSPPNCCCQNA